jgi:L-rhamnose isomerase
MNSYSIAQEAYAALGVDTEAALQRLTATPISLHCWQGDDVVGFETTGSELGGGLAVTGNYPGKARNMPELCSDLEQAYALIPGRHRLNLHACYADFSAGKVERNALTAKQFQCWIDWAKEHGLGMDFNPTCFAHPKAADGLTLTHPDAGIRNFWIDHSKACRRIGAEIGRQLGTPAVTNVWIPDGSKDLPADRKGPRARLEASLDEVFSEKLDPKHNLDAVESKLFGIGSEAYVAGSHEFYLGYAIKHQILYCLDAGHYHPTENLADKISSVLQYVPEILLHVSRGVRWDSDHVVILDDPTLALMQELVRGDFLGRTHIGLDYFDASINRVGAWVIGSRNTLKALLYALLEPSAQLRELEAAGDFTGRLGLMEEAKSLPWGLVWDEHCRRHNVPVGAAWIDSLRKYESSNQSKRG